MTVKALTLTCVARGLDLRRLYFARLDALRDARNAMVRGPSVSREYERAKRRALRAYDVMRAAPGAPSPPHYVSHETSHGDADGALPVTLSFQIRVY